MGMTAHNLRRRKLAEAQAKERAAAYKAAPPRNLAAELVEERAKNAQLAADLAAEQAAKAALEEELTDPQPKATAAPAGDLPATEDPKPQQPRPQGRGGRG